MMRFPYCETYPNVPWKDIAGMRDIIAHAYFKINLDRIWNIIEKELSPLRHKVQDILEKEKR
ncbi:TPA: DUF86 domain-containing protein [Candidatus Woesearchaeota archaeon]|nr:hypothetical protein [archaeon]HIJ11878.1 DUF86 domain-containing protein [Candidatus Woesearchaeota archaeon]|tara:strand:+ start:103 stop:288 length:186 start_codon:yes stop_codon:yes gene_type:complete